MKEYRIQQNKHDWLSIRWDGERIALISKGRWGQSKVIVMNPKEAHSAASFIQRNAPVS